MTQQNQFFAKMSANSIDAQLKLAETLCCKGKLADALSYAKTWKREGSLIGVFLGQLLIDKKYCTNEDLLDKQYDYSRTYSLKDVPPKIINIISTYKTSVSHIHADQEHITICPIYNLNAWTRLIIIPSSSAIHIKTNLWQTHIELDPENNGNHLAMILKELYNSEGDHAVTIADDWIPASVWNACNRQHIYNTEISPDIIGVSKKSWTAKYIRDMYLEDTVTIVNPITQLVPINRAVFMLIGYPGSGKTTASYVIQQSIGKKVNVIWINPDVDCTKQSYFDVYNTALNKIALYQGIIVIDRCNLDINSRRLFIESANKVHVPVIALECSIPYEICEQRIISRPIQNIGIGGFATLRDKLESANKKEGFSQIYHLIDSKCISELGIPEWHVSDIPRDYCESIYPFPRTPHLINLGAATEDDLICDEDLIDLFTNPSDIMVLESTEKVDGANFGISIDPKTYKFRFQNRGHWVIAETHHQFAKIDSWVERHKDSLYAVIRPGRDILFGEWCFATHSIKYVELSDWLMIYDLYDAKENKWLSRKSLENRLKNTSLSLVKKLVLPLSLTIDNIKQFLTTQMSEYNPNALIEGLYFKIYNIVTGEVIRAKVVRREFTASIVKHWTHGEFLINNLKLNLED